MESTPNTQGASWEEEFDKRFEDMFERYKLVMFPLDIKQFIREVVSKERAEGVEEGRIIEANNCRDSVIDCHPDYYGTLPADSTEV